MSYIGTQPNNVKKNIGLYNPNEILQLTKDGSWGGSLEHIETQTYSSSVSSVIFENLKEDLFDVHFMTLANVQGDTDSAGTRFVLYEDGIGYETSAVYSWSREIQTTGASGTEQKNNAIEYMSIFGTNDNNTNYKGHASVYWYNLGNASKYTFNTVEMGGKSYYETGFNFGGATLTQTSKITKIKFEISSGNFSSFDISLYGIKQL